MKENHLQSNKPPVAKAVFFGVVTLVYTAHYSIEMFIRLKIQTLCISIVLFIMNHADGEARNETTSFKVEKRQLSIL